MTLTEFADCCDGEAIFWECGEHDGNEVVRVRVERLERDGKSEWACLTAQCIYDNEWQRLRRAIKHGRDVYGVTRIVGYYSRTTNWNPSKVGELRDRQKGTYAV